MNALNNSSIYTDWGDEHWTSAGAGGGASVGGIGSTSLTNDVSYGYQQQQPPPPTMQQNRQQQQQSSGEFEDAGRNFWAAAGGVNGPVSGSGDSAPREYDPLNPQW